MAQLLEVVMLICFGLSWPISLIKTIRDKQAKSGNAPFMCLILLGYAAGIVAKLMTAGCNFVFYVYLLNILIVLANLIITLYKQKKFSKKSLIGQKVSPDLIVAK